MRDLLLNFLTVLLGSGAATAVMQIYFEHRRERRLRTDSAEYLALQLALQFEGYAIECAEKSSKHKLAHNSDGHAGGVISNVPEAPPYPQSEGFKWLDRQLLNDILEFPQRCRMANEAALFWWNVVGDRDCCEVAMLENTLLMGGRALDIARRLRRDHNLKARDMTFGQWNIAEFFDAELKKVQATERRRRKDDAMDITGETG